MKITLLKLSQVRTDDINAATTVDFDEQIKNYTVQSWVNKNSLPSFQGTDAGWRVRKYDREYFNYWNGWIFVDIDHIEENPEHELETLHEKLKHYPFYKASQLSYSKEGIHIYFYIEPYWHTVEEYYAYAILCYNIVFSYIDIKYFDQHNFIHSQVFKISQHKWYINENFNINDGQALVQTTTNYEDYCKNVRSMCPLRSQQFIDKADEAIRDWHNGGKVTNNSQTSKFVYKVDGEFKPSEELKPFHLNHNERFGVICALMGLYNQDKDKALSVYRMIMEYHLDGKHNKEWYKHEYDNFDTTKGYEAKPYWVKWLGDNFGLHVKTWFGNKVIELSDNEYLWTYKNEILGALKTGINMIVAGTGTGKTEFWKSLNKEVIDDFLAPNELPILVIEPYNSISTSKYDFNDVNIVTGSKHFPKQLTNNLMYVTNYNHINSDLQEDDDWTRFKYIVVDESHLLTKEVFRGETVIPFINKLKEVAKHSVIILQTGTPMDELQLFDDINIIQIVKKDPRNINYHFLQYNKELNDNKCWNLNYVSDLTNKLVSEGKKVYIYWNDGSLNNFKKFQEYNFNLKCALYHKRHGQENSEDMTWIDNKHSLNDGFENKYDVLLSSVYFGVGNDLNDSTDAAVIIIGNNTWQEDIQCIGRWRKSSNIDVYTILTDYKYDWSIEDEYDWMVNYKIKNLTYQFMDKTNRDKSITIHRQVFYIKDENDIPIWALMSVCDQWYSTIDLKISKLLEYGINVDKNITSLTFNKIDIERERIIKKQIHDIKDKEKQQTLREIAEFGEIKTWWNNDASLNKWQNVIMKIYWIDKDLYEKLIADKYIHKTSYIDSMSIFCDLVNNIQNDTIDAAELEAWKWYSKIIKEHDGKLDDTMWGSTITFAELTAAKAYTYFVHYKNKGAKDCIINWDYFSSFAKHCDAYLRMNNSMIEYLQYVKSEKANQDMLRNINEELDVLGLEKVGVKELYSINPFDTNKYVERSKFFVKSSEKVFLDELLKKINESHKAGRKGKKFEVDGIIYSSVMEYANKNQISKQAASKRLKKLNVI